MNCALLLWSLLPCTLQDAATGPANTSITGDSMLRRGYYAEAAGEYRRALFLMYGKADSLDPAARSSVAPLQLRLGLSLGAAGDADAAATALLEAARLDTGLAVDARMALAGFLELAGEHDRARLEVLKLKQLTQDSMTLRRLYRNAGWLDLQENDVRLASADFRAAGDRSLSDALAVVADRPRKSPLTAMLLSTVLPGAGECYAGRPDRGVTSLAVVGGSAAGVYLAASSGDWVSAAVVLSVLLLRFYSGSRSNAADLAEDYNFRKLRQGVSALEGAWDSRPDWFHGIRQLTGPGFPEALPDPTAPGATGFSRSR